MSFQFPNYERERERVCVLNKSLTVLSSKEQQGLASHVQESKSEAQLNTGQLKCLKLQQLAVKTVNLSVHLTMRDELIDILNKVITIYVTDRYVKKW